MNVNVTLIFALDAYENVITAYIRGLQRRLDAHQPLDVHSVASFFVSRVDTMVDGLLDERLKAGGGDPALLERLLGKAAIANARLAYATFERHFRGDAFRRLRDAGGHLQRPLWASTSAKNPKYRDVIYAEALIGPDTVDTMPPATVEAFRDHGVVAGDTVRDDVDGARRVIEELGSVGISVEKVTQDLLVAGVGSFAASYDQLIARIAEKLTAMRAGMGRRTRLHLALGGPSIADVVAETGRARVAERIWNRDPDLWKPGDAAHAAVISNRLGWLDVPVAMRQRTSELTAFAAEVRDAGLPGRRAARHGRLQPLPGGAAHLVRERPGFPVLHVLDTTDPVAITGLQGRLDLAHTLFLVASKSGTTLETTSHLAHFWDAVTAAGVADPGRSFVAITDPGTPLAGIAAERHFRRLFENRGDIGGRYSALSLFGLVPAAVMGLDVGTLLDRALAMRASCGAATARSRNPGLELGAALGLAHAAGHDKVTILASPRLGAFSLWAEQLIAESTGKEGKGYIPVGRGADRQARVYGDDRLFVALCLGSEPCHVDSQVDALIAARLPVVVLELSDPYDLGAEFFRWEFATAVAAVSLQIDPFDEPNVKESKDNTQSVLAGYEQSGSLPEEVPAASGDGVRVYGGDPAGSAGEALLAHLAQVRPGDYVAIMAYVDPSDAHEEALDELRTAHPGPLPGRDHGRLRAAVPPLHRPAPQGRAQHRGLHPGHDHRGRGCPHPGQALHLRGAGAGSGGGRPAVAAQPRTPGDPAARRRGARGPAGEAGPLGAPGPGRVDRLTRATPHAGAPRRDGSLDEAGAGRGSGAAVAAAATAAGDSPATGTSPSRPRPPRPGHLPPSTSSPRAAADRPGHLRRHRRPDQAQAHARPLRAGGRRPPPRELRGHRCRPASDRRRGVPRIDA